MQAGLIAGLQSRNIWGGHCELLDFEMLRVIARHKKGVFIVELIGNNGFYAVEQSCTASSNVHGNIRLVEKYILARSDLNGSYSCIFGRRERSDPPPH